MRYEEVLEELFREKFTRNKQLITRVQARKKKRQQLGNKKATSNAQDKHLLYKLLRKRKEKAQETAAFDQRALEQANDTVRKATLYNAEIGGFIANRLDKTIDMANPSGDIIRFSQQLTDIPPLRPLLTKTDPVKEAQMLRLLDEYIQSANRGDVEKMRDSIFHAAFESEKYSRVFSAFKEQLPLAYIAKEKSEGHLMTTLIDRMLLVNPALADLLVQQPERFRALYDVQVTYLVKNNFSDTRSLETKLGAMSATDDKVDFYGSLHKKLKALEPRAVDAIDEQLRQVNQAFTDFIDQSDSVIVNDDNAQIIKAFQSSVASSDQPILKKISELNFSKNTTLADGPSGELQTPSNTINLGAVKSTININGFQVTVEPTPMTSDGINSRHSPQTSKVYDLRRVSK